MYENWLYEIQEEFPKGMVYYILYNLVMAFFSNVTNSSGVSSRGCLIKLTMPFPSFFSDIFLTFSTSFAFSINSCNSLTMISRTSIEVLTLSYTSLNRLDFPGWAFRNIEIFPRHSRPWYKLVVGEMIISVNKNIIIFQYLKLRHILYNPLKAKSTS